MTSLLRRASLVLALAAVACSRKPPPPPPPATGDTGVVARGTPDAAPPIQYREPTDNFVDPALTGTGKTFMVVSEAPLASRAGTDVLVAGGNAVDAAIATAFALAVVHPQAGNLGGGGFAVVRPAPGKAVALDFREVAPAAATSTMYLDDQGTPTDASLVGHRASGVPGSVAGLWALHQKLGKKPWAELVAPAVALARDGFEVDKQLARALTNPTAMQRLRRFPASAAQWFRPVAGGASPLGVGDKVTQPELAATLERIAAKGPDGFYKGETAAAIVAEMKRGGGLITADDLAGYAPIWREPLRFTYRGHTITSMPPPSSGGVALAITAGMLKDVELAKAGWHSQHHVHWLAEVWKRAFAARNEVLGDPAFVKDMPVAKLLAPATHAALAKTIGDRATPSKDVAPLREGLHTTNLSVVDGSGLAIALTTTLNTSFGSGVTVTGAGFLLNNEMDDFAAKPGAPNTYGLVQGVANKIEPGKRMLSSMTPTIVEGPQGELVMVLGGQGGPRIITAVWQALSNVLDFGMPAAAAVANPRVHHQHLPDVVRVEASAIDRATEEGLRAAGHTLDWSLPPMSFGSVTLIAKSARGWDGAADPRKGGAAMGD